MNSVMQRAAHESDGDAHERAKRLDMREQRGGPVLLGVLLEALLRELAPPPSNDRDVRPEL